MEITKKILSAFGISDEDLKAIEDETKKIGDFVTLFEEKAVKSAIDAVSPLIEKDRSANYAKTIENLAKKMAKKGIIKPLEADTNILDLKLDDLVANHVEELKVKAEKPKGDDPKLAEVQFKLSEATKELNETKTAFSELETKHKELENSIPNIKESIIKESRKETNVLTNVVKFQNDGKILKSKAAEKAILNNPLIKETSLNDENFVVNKEGKLVQYKDADGIKKNHTLETLLLQVAKEEDVYLEATKERQEKRREEFKKNEERTTVNMKGVDEDGVSDSIRSQVSKVIKTA